MAADPRNIVRPGFAAIGELLDEGLMSAAEEQRIRRALLK